LLKPFHRELAAAQAVNKLMLGKLLPDRTDIRPGESILQETIAEVR
jgi:hypothetical protein